MTGSQQVVATRSNEIIDFKFWSQNVVKKFNNQQLAIYILHFEERSTYENREFIFEKCGIEKDGVEWNG